MKQSIKFLVYPLVVIFISLFVIIGCGDDDTEPTALFVLTLEVNPENAGIAAESGEYFEGEDVEIFANANHNWRFTNWLGATQYVNDPGFGNTTIKMPAYDITVIAHFAEKSIVKGEGVTDIDGNEYVTVIIGDQEWMAENLRVSKYNNGNAIPTGLSNEDWGNTTEGAYAVYPHDGGGISEDNVEGINSDEEMVAAYGKLYNWYAVDDPRGLCPEGWRVPCDDDWSDLLYYIETHGFPNGDITDGAANALKSCRQVGSPLGGDCDTSEHPRWSPDDTHHGFDEFGFSALPGGYRTGAFSSIGGLGYWWSTSEASPTTAWSQLMFSFHGRVQHFNTSGNKYHGLSVRCVRNIE